MSLNLSPAEQKHRLADLAYEQGFALFGVAAAQPPPHAEAFERWLEDGRHATMEWMRRSQERRTQPDLVLPGIRSVVCLGVSYWQGGEAVATHPEGTTGRIARYAWGGDYHDWILDRLRPLEEQLAAWGGVQKPYTDTGPVLERDFAALAGLGWHGKSTMLIHRRVGTWFFLA
jgi:epoxyqueuosine reductase